MAVLAVAAGAGLVLLGASRVWRVEVVTRPAPLRPEEITYTGGSLAPLLPALGLVALAAAGGLLATRGAARRLVGAVLGVVAVAVAVAVIGALAGAGPLWPAACLAGAVLIGAAGALTVRDGGRWPVMGARYGRGQPHRPSVAATARPPTAPPGPSGGEPSAPSGASPQGPSGADPQGLSGAELWDAVDRGLDPTRD